MGRFRDPLFRRDRRGASVNETSLARALIALHYQNDICHPDGKIPFAIDRAASSSTQFLEASRKALERARQLGFVIVHVHIAFSPDYADLPRHGRLFRKVEELGAVNLGSWGAEAYEGFEPLLGETFLIHKGNSAFFATGLQEILEASAVTDLTVCGLATQFSVEHTVRDAADRGFRVKVLRDCCAAANPAAAFEVMSMLAEVAESTDWP
jgi:nicotinamidase-related amidase